MTTTRIPFPTTTVTMTVPATTTTFPTEGFVQCDTDEECVGETCIDTETDEIILGDSVCPPWSVCVCSSLQTTSTTSIAVTITTTTTTPIPGSCPPPALGPDKDTSDCFGVFPPGTCQVRCGPLSTGAAVTYFCQDEEVGFVGEGPYCLSTTTTTTTVRTSTSTRTTTAGAVTTTATTSSSTTSTTTSSTGLPGSCWGPYLGENTDTSDCFAVFPPHGECVVRCSSGYVGEPAVYRCHDERVGFEGEGPVCSTETSTTETSTSTVTTRTSTTTTSTTSTLPSFVACDRSDDCAGEVCLDVDTEAVLSDGEVCGPFGTCVCAEVSASTYTWTTTAATGVSTTTTTSSWAETDIVYAFSCTSSAQCAGGLCVDVNAGCRVPEASGCAPNSTCVCSLPGSEEYVLPALPAGVVEDTEVDPMDFDSVCSVTATSLLCTDGVPVGNEIAPHVRWGEGVLLESCAAQLYHGQRCHARCAGNYEGTASIFRHSGRKPSVA